MTRLFAGIFLALALVVIAPSVYGVVAFRLIELDGQYIKWDSTDLGTPAHVTVGFANSVVATPDARNCREIGPLDGLLERSGITWPRLRSELRAALDAWEQVAGITFELVEDPARADILIGAQVRPRGHAFVNVAHEQNGAAHVSTLVRSIVCLNPAQSWKLGFDGNLDVYDLRYTLTHEIGHAIGLNHPGPSGQLMSFRYQEDFADLQQGDIEGAVLLYGEPQAR